jgi:hypothetical protein
MDCAEGAISGFPNASATHDLFVWFVWFVTKSS